MDKLAFYRSAIKTIIHCHAELQNGNSILETVPIYDTDGDNYLLMAIGWNSSGRVHCNTSPCCACSRAMSIFLRVASAQIKYSGLRSRSGSAASSNEACRVRQLDHSKG